MDSTTDATIERLRMKDMFEKAEREGLFFWTGYQDLWFSPAELRKAISEGRFRWGACNWELRTPKEREAELEAGIAAKQRELAEWRARRG